jgi:tRNA-dihydrouridine synthase 3
MFTLYVFDATLYSPFIQQLASTDSRDWVKISEMFLGKSPEDFEFVPKHKSNSYGAEDNQG